MSLLKFHLQKRFGGPAAIGLCVIAMLMLWALFPPPPRGAQAAFDRQVTSEIVASVMVVLFAWAQLLATRARWLEPFFGGLDRMYFWHRNAALVAFVLTFLHFWLTPLDTANVKPGTPMGLISFFGILVLVLLTIAPRLPGLRWILGLSYGSWRLTHKLIGFFFFIGFVHMMLVDPLVRTTTPPFIALFVAFLIGIFSWVYALIVARFTRRPVLHAVEATRKLNPSVIELVLRPVKDHMVEYRSGQFVFVRFKGDWRLGEPHPFTVSSSPREDVLRLTIKASGDFTQRVYDHLEPGMHAVVEGSYGYFHYGAGGPKQIWVAAGVGITPFMSWIRDFGDEPKPRIDLFYTVRTPEDLLFREELEQARARYENLRVLFVVSSRDGTLGVKDIRIACGGDISGHEVFMCGPPGLTSTFARDFRKCGIPRRRIHFELFNFR